MQIPQNAEHFNLPNIRRLYIPDPGYDIYDCDLSGADAQVVAWEAEDEDLKSAFRAGVKIHLKNVRDVFPEKVKGWSDEAIKATDRPHGIYHNSKRMVHGSNYGGTPRGMAGRIGVTVREVENFQRNWFGLHPGIKDWHNRTAENLMLYRKVENKFRYDRTYFGRVETLLPEALAWVPQSTVALVTFKAALRLKRDCPWVEILLQVHDSLVFQMKRNMRHTLPQLKEALHVPVPYSDPLTIPWGISRSDRSWGDCEAIRWESND